MASSYILSDNGLSSGSAGLKSSAGNDGVLVLQTANSSGTATNAVFVDNSQNMGLGATPSAWGGVSLGRVFQTGGAAFYGRTDTPDAYVATNTYRDSSNTWRYQTTAAAGFTQLSGKSLYLYGADSGTAGNAITFTQTIQVGKDATLALQGATSQSGTGITFPATQSASSDANTLDDYEEGTFTPTAYGGSTAGTTTYNTQTGKYVKIGRQVTVTVRLGITSMTGTGVLTIGGLPFAGEGSDYVGAMMTDGLPYPGSSTSINSYQAGVNTAMILWGNTSNAAWATILVDSNCSFITVITYFTS